MNLAHRWICRSRWWRKALADDLLPWALDGIVLGKRTLEIGPGFGLTTALLEPLTQQLVCAEVDGTLAAGLDRAAHGGKFRTVCGDATMLPFGSASFESVLGFTVLHHVSPIEAQFRLFAEVARVLQPGGVFAGTDSVNNKVLRLLHLGGGFAPVDPGRLEERLIAAGFCRAEVKVRQREFRFRAWRGRSQA